MECQVKAFSFKPGGQRPASPRRHLHVENTLAVVTAKVTVLAHVRAEPGRAALQRQLSRQPARHQRFQAIVHRGQRYIRHSALGPNKNFFRGRVIAFPQQHRINLPPLGGKPESAPRQGAAQVIAEFFSRGGTHSTEQVSAARTPVNIWNNSKEDGFRGGGRSPSARPTVARTLLLAYVPAC